MKDKRFIIIIASMVVLSVAFWSSSRYPALNDKVITGSDTSLSGIGFETLLTSAPDSSFVTQALYTGVNWLYSNKEGMTFGLLFGTLLMALLHLLHRQSMQSRFANTILGVFIGIPLGVCVNCATPIAKAIHDANGRTETMLATMISAPTLNIIVLTLLLALFPMYMVMIKIGLVVAFILIGIPLLTRLFPLRVATESAETQGWFNLSGASSLTGRLAEHAKVEEPLKSVKTWLDAGRWVARNSAINLWFLAKTTVPLMLLAGLLGAALVTVLPLESLVDTLPNSGRFSILAAIALVAGIGIFLPVPITFDVVITAALWRAGLPTQYAMALLFTLGIFSIFPFFVVWKSISAWLAIALLIGLSALGIVAGVLGYWGFQVEAQRHEQIVFEYFSRRPDSLRGPSLIHSKIQHEQAKPYAAFAATLSGDAAVAQATSTTSEDDISVGHIALRAPQAPIQIDDGGTLFRRVNGGQFGIVKSSTFSPRSFVGPFTQFRGVSSGDVHNDGWPDILLTLDSGISLFANHTGSRFTRQQIDIPELRNVYVVIPALVDLNNDGWLDIFLATHQNGNYVVYNRGGEFTQQNLRRIPVHTDSQMIGASAFGDLDKDGDLDIVAGAWVAPIFHGLGAMRSNSSVLLQQDNGQFQENLLSKTPGTQVLSILLSDFDMDGSLDLVIGGEDSAPDSYFLGNGDGTFQPIARTAGIIARSPGTTMSITSADIDNDLLPEIYVGQIAAVPDRDHQRETDMRICDEIVEPIGRAYCARIIKMHQAMPSQTNNRSVENCLRRGIGRYREDCIAMSLLLTTMERGPLERCALLPNSWAFFRELCTHGFNGGGPRFAAGARPFDASGSQVKYWRDAIPIVMMANVLLKGTPETGFFDVAEDMGVSQSGFTWNSKFADLDNDEFVDLFVANGWFPGPQRTSNYFYRNQQGKKFTEETAEAGLTSYLTTSAYTYVDFDNDGDVDIITVPIIGPVQVFVNDSTKNRIAFELRDELGNHFGIGSKITIHYGTDGARHQRHEIQASGGFISFDAPIAHFGLGTYQSVKRVEIDWSTGENSEIRGTFSAGNRYVITRHGLSVDND